MRLVKMKIGIHLNQTQEKEIVIFLQKRIAAISTNGYSPLLALEFCDLFAGCGVLVMLSIYFLFKTALLISNTTTDYFNSTKVAPQLLLSPAIRNEITCSFRSSKLCTVLRSTPFPLP